MRIECAEPTCDKLAMSNSNYCEEHQHRSGTVLRRASEDENTERRRNVENL